MIGWLRRRVERLADDMFEALDPDACPDCLGEGITTVYDPWLGAEHPDFCRRCGGTGRKDQR